MNVNFTPQAIADLGEIHLRISQFDRNAADRVLSRIRQVIEIFESFPLLGREGGVEDTREFAISGLPYTIVYRDTIAKRSGYFDDRPPAQALSASGRLKAAQA
ncbi:type II toxin-antitoxin system RelE/ParE family toxin [Neorhizobium tomejilense]|uniref:type II toxin-antitoxin system RelE/ParE family toxin n=1 Tax=Neorhizobium tomejilense TaxID=2093828 RepID=UPI003ECDD5EC